MHVLILIKCRSRLNISTPHGELRWIVPWKVVSNQRRACILSTCRMQSIGHTYDACLRTLAVSISPHCALRWPLSQGLTNYYLLIILLLSNCKHKSIKENRSLCWGKNSVLYVRFQWFFNVQRLFVEDKVVYW